MEKYTKKATARILKEVLKFKPDASGFTTLDQAFVILMDEWDLDISVEGHKDSTLVVLHKDGEKPKEWKFKNLWIPNEGDFDWNVIYKTVLEDIIYDKLYKRPKLGKRAQAKLEKEKAERKKQAKVEVEETEVVTVVIPQKEAPVDLEGLRDKRDALTMKIWYLKKEGKDTKELEYEKEEMNLMIRKLAKELKAKKS